MTDELYIGFIENVISVDGYIVADKANKIALASKQITLEQYQIAARMIVKAMLNIDLSNID